MPLGIRGAESCSQPFSVHHQLETARCARRVPLRYPVLGANKNLISIRSGKLDHSGRILDWPAKPVRQQVRRTHLIHELRIYYPAARIREAFGFDEHC